MQGYMFAGQGAQYEGMGSKLYETSAAARKVFDEADALLGYSISKLCFKGSLQDLTPCAACQPAIFVVSMAALAAYGEQHPEAAPAICGGLSLGEFSAACCASIMDFQTGLGLVAERGRLMDECCRKYPGSMAAVIGGEPQVIEECCKQVDIDIANYNCPGQVVVSGELGKLDKVCELLDKAEIKTIRLTVAGAYHSRLMAEASELFGKVLENSELHKPSCEFVQNVTGGPVGDVEEIRRNLTRQVCSSVRWENCARHMMTRADALVEFGPGTVLTKLLRRMDRKFPAANPNL